MIRSKRGAGLVEVMFAVFVLGMAGIVFSSSFPAGFTSLQQSSEYSIASRLAQKKVEQVRSLDYASLTYANLMSNQILDDDTTNGYCFTSVDGVNTALPQGSSSFVIASEAGDIKRVTVTVSWVGHNDKARSLVLKTLVADTTPWVK